MNRNEEYKALLSELETTPPALEYTVTRAKARRRRRQWLWRPAAGLAGLFAAFVLLVNVSAPVAHAVSRVPGLDKLAEAVTFSRSLAAAVDNEFVQTVDQEQTQNGVTMRIEYLIVDQKQVNVFYTVTGEGYDWLDVTPGVQEAEGDEDLAGFVLSSGGNTDDLRYISVDFVEREMPSRLRLTMKISGRHDTKAAPMASVEEDMFKSPEEWDSENESDIIARMEFLLEFDPSFTRQGRTVTVNETVTLDGQRITVTDLEIFPTHMRLNVAPDPENTAWLKGLSFYVENPRGARYDPASSGITATGDGEGQMVSYRVDSTWFYEEKHLTLVITGAEWLDKDRQRVHLDLTTGETDWMPQGTEIYGVERLEKGWIVTVLAAMKEEDGPMYSVFVTPWYDAEGGSHEIRTWSSHQAHDDNGERIDGYFVETFPLVDCQETEVWLTPTFSRLWTAEDPVTVTLR